MLPSLRNYAMTFLVSIVVFGALAYFFTVFAMRSFTDTGTDAITTSDTEAVTDSGIFDPFANVPQTESSTIQGDSFNFVLVGLDYQPTVFEDYSEDIEAYLKKALSGTQDAGVETALTYEQKRSISADAILICRVDKEDKRLLVSALSGNTRVFIDGVYTDLGSVLVNKGISYFTAKITALTGLKMDYYAVVTIPSMISIIDHLGGISYQVPCDMTYEDPEEGLEISLQAGSQWLSGTTAVKMLRYASYDNRDISRMTLLRNLASSMLSNIASYTTIANAPDLFKALRDSVTTNFGFADFTDRLDLIFKISEFTVVNYTYPGTMITYNGDSYFSPDTAAAITALAKYR